MMRVADDARTLLVAKDTSLFIRSRAEYSFAVSGPARYSFVVSANVLVAPDSSDVLLYALLLEDGIIGLLLEDGVTYLDLEH